uniref:Fibronectin type-III domain-containing protein n=1 Tax=Periophthalmus magnuspinnatus TaxID=409849 RepID=A0A3B4AYA2_9GOBI
ISEDFSVCVCVSPEVPAISKTYSKSSESITVEFPNVTGATFYVVRAESKIGTFFSETRVMGSPGTIQGLQPYTEYEISIMSGNAGGRSQPSYPNDQKTVIVAPNLKTKSPTNSSIVVTWDPVDHAELYTFVIIQEGSTVPLNRNTTETLLELNNLQPGTNYTIKAQALDDMRRPGDDQTFSQITRPATPDVLDVQINQGKSTTLIYWGLVTGASNYTVLTSNNQTCKASSDSYCFIGPVECGQNQTLSVTAYNEAGPSEPSNPALYLTCGVEEYEPGNCSVMWDEVKMVDYYMVFVKGNDGNEKMCNTTETRCSFECTCGHSFISLVVPYNSAGGSPVFELVNYTTIPCCPDRINITLVSSETVEIEWSEVSGAELYEVTAEETNDIIHCNDTETICALSDLHCDTTYSIKVTPCSEIRGCNKTCKAHTQVTAPCAPEIINITQVNADTYRVHYSTPNKAGTAYTITASAPGTTQPYVCTSTESSCELTGLPCGTVFEVMGAAWSNDGGRSLPGYEEILETGPCCPQNVVVKQVTQAMTNVSWSHATGASSFITSLTSRRGEAKCHTVDNSCLMGCITCGTNYTISMEAISTIDHVSHFTGPCCPTNIKLYRKPDKLQLRVYWRSLGPHIYNHTVALTGQMANLKCEAAPGVRYCDVLESACGNVYTVLVAPVLPDGTKTDFCQERTYSGKDECLSIIMTGH